MRLLAELIHAQLITKIQRGNRGVLEDEAMEASGSGSGATAHRAAAAPLEATSAPAQASRVAAAPTTCIGSLGRSSSSAAEAGSSNGSLQSQ